MKQKRSSANPFTHTFAESIRSTNLIAALLLLFVVSFIMIAPILYPLTVKEAIMNPVTGVQEGYETAKDKFIYYLFAESNYAAILVSAAMLIGGILMGMSSFKFITAKKTVNVYYSLGIKREKLFLAHYLSGGLLIVIASVLAVFAAVLMNLIFIGSSVELWTAALYYMISLATIGLFSYSITAAVASSVGTVFEGGIFSLIISLLPTLVLSSVQMLMDKLVWGNPFGKFFQESLADYRYVSPSLATQFSFLTPITAFTDAFLGIARRDKPIPNAGEAVEKAQELYELAARDYLTVLVWLVAVALIFFLGMYLFKRRRAEISGFIGTNRVMNNLGIFVVSIFSFSAFYSALPLGTYVALAIAFLSIVIVYLVLDAVLRRSFREFKKDLIFLPGHLVVAGLIFTVFATGLFGYSKRVPEIDSIKSASISLIGSNSFAGNFYSGRPDVLSYAGTDDMLPGLTSEKDIKLVREIHSKIAKGEPEDTTDMWKYADNADLKRLISRVQFSYYLKNGKVVRRSFKDVTAADLADLLKVYDTDRFKQVVAEALSPDADVTKNEQASTLRSDNNIFRAIPGDMTHLARLNLNAQQKNALLDALRQDLAEQTHSERYFPEKPPIGMISVINIGMVDGGDKPLPDVEVITPEIGMGKDDPNAEPELPPSGEPWDVIDASPNLDIADGAYANVIFVITEDMERTVKFLKDNNMLDAFKGTEKKYNSVSIVSLERTLTFQPYMIKYRYDLSYDSYGKAFSKAKGNQEFNFYNPLENQQVYTVTDQETIKALKELAYGAYYTKGTGYAVIFNASDDTTQNLYIPASKMPAALASAVRSFDEAQLKDFNLSNY